MSKILVVGDIHNKHLVAQKYIDRWEAINPDGLIVLLGDYFDDFYDSVEDVIATAQWLKESLTKPNHIHLYGNHDIHYALPIKSETYCSGYTLDKHIAIQTILTKEDWSKLKYFYAHDNYWFSHAGVTSFWFSHPVEGITVEVIERAIAKAQIGIDIGDYTMMGCLYAADSYRGGRYPKGGLLWNDWRNKEYIKGITQVVGHTPRECVKWETRKGGTCINVDTHLKEVIVLNTEDGTFEVWTTD